MQTSFAHISSKICNSSFIPHLRYFSFFAVLKNYPFTISGWKFLIATLYTRYSWGKHIIGSRMVLSRPKDLLTFAGNSDNHLPNKCFLLLFNLFLIMYLIYIFLRKKIILHCLLEYEGLEGRKFVCFVHWHISNTQNSAHYNRCSINICSVNEFVFFSISALTTTLELRRIKNSRVLFF